MKVVTTEHARSFFDLAAFQTSFPDVEVYTDAMEWNTWKVRGDPVVHIEVCTILGSGTCTLGLNSVSDLAP